MTEHDPTRNAKIEGEGSHSAARDYNERTEKFVATADIDKAAEEAAAALDGPEGGVLRDAEAEGESKKADDGKNKR